MFLWSYYIHICFVELLHSYMFWRAIAFIYVLGSYCIHIIMFWEPFFIRSVWELGIAIFIRSVWEVGRAFSFIFSFFSFRLLSVLRVHSVFSSPPQRPMTSDFEGFSIPVFIHYIYFPILILEKEPVFSLLNVEF